MKRAMITGVLGLALVGGFGCKGYEDERPPVDQLDSRDKGLQSKDIIQVTDEMAQSILGNKRLNARPEQLTIVIDQMDGEMTTPFPQRIFMQRLGTLLGKHGEGRIQLVENRDRLRGMQSRELDTPGGRDDFGQGGGAGLPAIPRLQADYALNGTITELRSSRRGTSYYNVVFNITGIKGPDAGKRVWTDQWDVKVAN